jgi:hypothetical protein
VGQGARKPGPCVNMALMFQQTPGGTPAGLASGEGLTWGKVTPSTESSFLSFAKSSHRGDLCTVVVTRNFVSALTCTRIGVICLA